MAAFLSGEMKDTVQMNPAGAYGILVFLTSYQQIADEVQFLNDFSLVANAKGYSEVGQGVPACGLRWVFYTFPFAQIIESSRAGILFGGI